MRKLILCFFVVVLSAVAAQAATNAEVFGGYQYTRFNGGTNASGWNAALTGNLNSWFGVTADFSGVYPSGVHFLTYTFGPELHAHLPIVKPYVHALFGGIRASASGASTNGFDMMIGGGIDAGHGTIAWRVVQFDWMSVRFNGVSDNKNVRASTGVVFRF
jgi:hypothetical protein